MGEKISTIVHIAGGNLPIDPILCKSTLKGKNVPNFDDEAKCFENFSNKQNGNMNPQKKCKIHYFNNQKIYHKTFVKPTLYPQRRKMSRNLLEGH